MAKLLAFTKRFGRDESGQDLIEYALIAGLIGVACVGAMTGLATAIGTGFGNVGDTLSNAL